MGRSDFSADINRSLLPSSRLPTFGPAEVSWGKIEQCPASSAFTTRWPSTDIGRCVRRWADPGPRSPAESSLTFGAAVRLRLPPHRLSRNRHRLSNVQAPSRAVAFTSWLPLWGSTGDFYPQSLDDAQRTFRLRLRLQNTAELPNPDSCTQPGTYTGRLSVTCAIALDHFREIESSGFLSRWRYKSDAVLHWKA